MRPARRFLAGILIGPLLAAVGAPTIACAETIKVGGAGFGLGAMKILAATFEKSHPGVSIKVIPSLGSTGGIKALLAGSLDLALSGRPLNGTEAGAGGIARELARTPFVFMVNRTVDRKGITTRELEKIYAGEMLAWPDGSRLRLVLRPDTETDTELVRRISPALNVAVTAALSREGMIRARTDQQNAEKIEKTPGTLGGGTLTQISSENRQVSVLALNGVTPTVANLRKGSYPLFKSLYLVTTTKTSPAAREFAAFIRSKAGSAILARYDNLVTTTDKNAMP